MAKKVNKSKPTKFTFTPMVIFLILLGVLAGGTMGYYFGNNPAGERKDKKYHQKETDPQYQSGPYTPCEPLTIHAPGKGEQITSPTTITVTVDNTNPKCRWTVFEAQAGTMELQNANGEVIGTGTLTTEEEWMTDQPVTYTGEMMFDTTITTPKLNLVINEENPSGEPGQQIIHPLTY